MNAVDAYVFDLYGTLVDYGSLRSIFTARVADPDAFVATWRQKQLQYALTATSMDRYTDFDRLTVLAFRYAAALHGLSDEATQNFEPSDAWSKLPAFPDVLPALQALRARGIRAAVLSNGTPRGLAAVLAASGLVSALETALSVDAVREYKPRPAVYALAVRHFATSPQRIVFVSSNGWDVTGAAEFGFRAVWCNRSGLPAETFGKPPERTFQTLDALIDA
jgi:2-haloacid dehalogenase